MMSTCTVVGADGGAIRCDAPFLAAELAATEAFCEKGKLSADACWDLISQGFEATLSLIKCANYLAVEPMLTKLYDQAATMMQEVSTSASSCSLSDALFATDDGPALSVGTAAIFCRELSE
jgi:hypothetical protein